MPVPNVKPRLFLVECVEMNHSQFNGNMIHSEPVRKLKNYVDIVSICPEKALGLKVPRSPMRLVKINHQIRLIQTDTEKDFTERLMNYAIDYAETLTDHLGCSIDGFILKSGSPVCGLNDVRVYEEKSDAIISTHQSGLFTLAIRHKCNLLPAVDENKISDPEIFDNFLTRIYMIAGFRTATTSPSLTRLQEFHRRNKFLLMSYQQNLMKKLGNIAANRENLPDMEAIRNYRHTMLACLDSSRLRSVMVNVLQHITGFFKKQLSKEEKNRISKLIKEYRNRLTTLENVLVLLREWAERFHAQYIIEQTLFDPYPRELKS